MILVILCTQTKISYHNQCKLLIPNLKNYLMLIEILIKVISIDYLNLLGVFNLFFHSLYAFIG